MKALGYDRNFSTQEIPLLQVMLMVLQQRYLWVVGSDGGGTRLHKWNDMKEVKEMCKLQNSHQNHLCLIHNNVLCTKRYLFASLCCCLYCWWLFWIATQSLIASSAFRCISVEGFQQSISLYFYVSTCL